MGCGVDRNPFQLESKCRAILLLLFWPSWSVLAWKVYLLLCNVIHGYSVLPGDMAAEAYRRPSTLI